MGLKTICCSIVILTLSNFAFAELGENSNSVDGDNIKFHGQKKIIKSAQNSNDYSIHKITTDTGVIKEYLNSDGLVFTITWRGLTHPDLSILLGSYYKEYKDLNANRRGNAKAPNFTKTSKIIVQKAGNMRDVRGLAFLPGLAPSDLEMGDLK